MLVHELQPAGITHLHNDTVPPVGGDTLWASGYSAYEKLSPDFRKIIDGKLLRARGVYGLFPAAAVGDDVELYTDAGRSGVLTRFHFLRQQAAKGGEGCRSLSDFIAPREAGLPDHLGAFAVAIHGAEELAREYERQHDDYMSILTKAVADHAQTGAPSPSNKTSSSSSHQTQKLTWRQIIDSNWATAPESR